MSYTITAGTKAGAIEVYFDGKPSTEIITALKAMRMRWNPTKKCWYGFTTEATARQAINGQDSGEHWKKIEGATTAPVGYHWENNGKSRFGGEYKQRLVKDEEPEETAKATPIKFFYNGFKVNGAKELQKCGYSIDFKSGTVCIYAKCGVSIPRDLFDVKNDTDIYTDYFDNDSAYVTTEHPLYRFVYYAASKYEIKMLKSSIDYRTERINNGIRDEELKNTYIRFIEEDKKHLQELEALTDPGHPTNSDLLKIDAENTRKENEKRQAEHEEQLRQREEFLKLRNEGRDIIKVAANKHPQEEGAPTCKIVWSEHPAFMAYKELLAYESGELKACCGADENIPAHFEGDENITFSLKAAEEFLPAIEKHLNEVREEHGYYKTKFEITYKDADDDAEESSYAGRYDIGDNDGGIINHIRTIGEYYRTHTEYGQEKQTPDESNAYIDTAERLAALIA